MKRFLLYGHGGAYNHGAEAIAKTTASIIRKKYKNAYIGLSSHFPEQDKEYALDVDEYFAPISSIWEAEKQAKTEEEKKNLAKKMYAKALGFISADTTCLSIGGDNFCYQNWHRLAVFQDEVKRKKAKSILWGCSIEPSLITPEMIAVLNSYTFVLAREHRTYNALKNQLSTAVALYPDSAFLLKSEPVKMPTGFQPGQIIGINLSPLVFRKEPTPGILMENVRNLIHFILSETNMNIALIPHVVTPADNDYQLLLELLQIFPESFKARVWLAGASYSAVEYKFLISKCKLFVCARTHASIASYSSCVPTLVIGYSVKSVGIAEDLGMSEFILNIAEIKSPYAIKVSFQKLLTSADKVRNMLDENTRHYIEQAQNYIEYI